jgi:Helicase HerA, central domain
MAKPVTEFRFPAAQLYRESLLVGDEFAKTVNHGPKNPQPIKIVDAAGQEHLGELHKEYKVLSGVGEIFQASGAARDSMIVLTVNKVPGSVPSITMRVEASKASTPTGMHLGLYHKATGAQRKAEGTPFYLDPKRLKTHAFVCGMTGSGKTVLTKAIIEEALMAGIPVVVIDLKGDLASLGVVPLALPTDKFAIFCKEETDAPGMEFARALGETEQARNRLKPFGIDDDRCKKPAD